MPNLNKLFFLPEALHAEGCPIVILAGALYKLDTADEKLLLQLKFKNIGQKTAKAIKVTFHTFDVTGNTIDEKLEHQYLDLHLRHTTEHTDHKGVPLNTKTIRSFTVEITEIVFEDGTIWSDSNAEFAPLPARNSIENKLDANLVSQYKREIGTQAVYEPFEYKDLWFCCCGKFNHNSEECCHRCKTDKNKQFHSLDTSLLTENKKAFEKHVEELSKKRAAAERMHKEARRKSAIKFCKIAGITFTILVLAVFLINKAATRKAYNEALASYNNGISLMEQGNYNKAEDIFYELSTFKDSSEKYNECIYQSGLICFENGDLESALQAFKKIPDYKDSEQQIELVHKEEKYVECLEKIKENNGGNMSSVKEAFEELDGYKDSEKHLKGFVKRVNRQYQMYKGELSRENYCYYDNEGYLKRMSTTKGFTYTYNYSYSKDKRTVTIVRSYNNSSGSSVEDKFILKYDANANIVAYNEDSFLYKYNNNNTVSRQIGKQYTNLGDTVTTTTDYIYENDNLVRTEKSYKLPSSNLDYSDIHYFNYDENNNVISIQEDDFDPYKYEYGWFYAPESSEDSELMTTLTRSIMFLFFV